MNTFKEEYEKSAVVASTEYEIKLLEKSNSYFLDLHIEKQNDGKFVFEYVTNGEIKLEEADKLSNIEKYRLLLNVLKTENIYQIFEFTLNPNNLYIDYNLDVKVAYRDLKNTNEFNNFLDEVKTLYICLFQTKYTYQELKESGISLAKEKKLIEKINDISSIDELKEALLQEFEDENQKQKRLYTLTPKKSYKKLKIFSRIITVMFIVVSLVLGYFLFMPIPKDKKLISIYEKFIKNDYVGVTELAKKGDVSSLDYETKYVIAQSFIKTEALSDTQKKNIMAGITQNTDEKVLDYWVCLTVGDIDESIDLAKKMGDDEYLVYAYMKKKDSINKNDSLSGNEKEEQINAIDTILEKYVVEDEDDDK